MMRFLKEVIIVLERSKMAVGTVVFPLNYNTSTLLCLPKLQRFAYGESGWIDSSRL